MPSLHLACVIKVIPRFSFDIECNLCMKFVWHGRYKLYLVNKLPIWKPYYLFKKMNAARWRESDYRCCYLLSKYLFIQTLASPLLVWIMEILYNLSINVTLTLSLPCHHTLCRRMISPCFPIHLLSILTFNRIIVCTQLSCTSTRYMRVRSLISVVTSRYVPFGLLPRALSLLLHNKLELCIQIGNLEF